MDPLVDICDGIEVLMEAKLSVTTSKCTVYSFSEMAQKECFILMK
jgi:hypothetical protein